MVIVIDNVLGIIINTVCNILTDLTALVIDSIYNLTGILIIILQLL